MCSVSIPRADCGKRGVKRGHHCQWFARQPLACAHHHLQLGDGHDEHTGAELSQQEPVRPADGFHGEGVLQRTVRQTYVRRPDWTSAASASTGLPQIGVDGQGRIYLQTSQGARQWLLPSLLSAVQVGAIAAAAASGAALAVQQPAASDGSLVLTLAGQRLRLVPQWVLP